MVRLLEKVVVMEKSDRLVWLRWDDNGDLIGVNFMHGAGDIDHFDPYRKNDPVLFNFVKGVAELVEYKSISKQEYKLDEIICLYVSFTMEYDESKLEELKV